MNAATFTRDWEKAFGEKLLAKDLTREACGAHLRLAAAGSQAKRYAQTPAVSAKSRSTPRSATSSTPLPSTLTP